MNTIHWVLVFTLLASANVSCCRDANDCMDAPGSIINPWRVRRSAKAFRAVTNQEEMIPGNYKVFEPPPTTNDESMSVNFSIILMNIRHINEKDEEITLEMNLRMFWKDTRLSMLSSGAGDDSFVVLNPNLLQRIWHPDVFIDHSISVSQPAILTVPASLRMYPGSVVRYSARLTVTIACKMDFHFYPLDTQMCNIQMQSYAYPTSIIELAWHKRGASMARELILPNFDVRLVRTTNFTLKTGSGAYSNLVFTISLQRKLSHHLIQAYSPSTIFLVISWLSFLIPKESVPERIGSCMMTLLTLTVMFGSVGQSMPKVSYLTALDIWMVTCIVFVFVALIEFTVVLKLWSMAKSERENFAARLSSLVTKNDEKKNNSGNGIDFTMINPGHFLDMKESESRAEKLLGQAAKLEKVASSALPFLFLVFNCTYWPWLILNAEGGQE